MYKRQLGDNVDKSHPLSDATAGRFNIALMNELGIDYATIGNNEGIGLAKDELDCLYEQAQFQPIIGNLKDEEGQPECCLLYTSTTYRYTNLEFQPALGWLASLQGLSLETQLILPNHLLDKGFQ